MTAYYCKYVVFLYILVHDCTFLCVDVYFAKIMGWKGFICFKASLPGLKNSGGVGGGAAPPICKHNARIMGLEGFIRVEASLPAPPKKKKMCCLYCIFIQYLINKERNE